VEAGVGAGVAEADGVAVATVRSGRGASHPASTSSATTAVARVAVVRRMLMVTPVYAPIRA
jgi:hypothetical protein